MNNHTPNAVIDAPTPTAARYRVVGVVSPNRSKVVCGKDWERVVVREEKEEERVEERVEEVDTAGEEDIVICVVKWYYRQTVIWNGISAWPQSQKRTGE